MTVVSLAALEREVRKLANPTKAKSAAWFFKTGPGDYGEGDQFIGLTVPKQRGIARRFRELPLSDALKLLKSPVHEKRLIALFIMVEHYRRGDEAARHRVYQAYLRNTKLVNNWDLVDSSAAQIVGAHLTDKPRGILPKLARSQSLWERRISIIATYAFIKAGESRDTLKIAKLLLADEHDLIHKAVGWMLRELGNRDPAAERGFLDKHADTMPRTMLRYAIEKFPETERQRYLAARRR